MIINAKKAISGGSKILTYFFTQNVPEVKERKDVEQRRQLVLDTGGRGWLIEAVLQDVLFHKQRFQWRSPWSCPLGRDQREWVFEVREVKSENKKLSLFFEKCKVKKKCFHSFSRSAK